MYRVKSILIPLVIVSKVRKTVAAKDFPEYRMQEFLGAFGEALQSDNIDKIIFVPTEANIPVTEAGRSVE